MSAATMTLSQVRYVNKAFWRSPARAGFTVVQPLLFLVIFTSLLGNGTVHIGGTAVKESTYYVASMAALGVITACMFNIAISMTFNREAGILKRIDGTPLPHAAFFASRILHAMLVALLLVAITTAFGHIAYDAHVPSGIGLPRFLVMLLVGSASFCALGLAITAAIPNADAAAPIVNITVLPLLFLSGVFIPFGNSTPEWIVWVARIFPVRHFVVGRATWKRRFTGAMLPWSPAGGLPGFCSLFVLQLGATPMRGSRKDRRVAGSEAPMVITPRMAARLVRQFITSLRRVAGRARQH